MKQDWKTYVKTNNSDLSIRVLSHKFESTPAMRLRGLSYLYNINLLCYSTQQEKDICYFLKERLALKITTNVFQNCVFLCESVAMVIYSVKLTWSLAGFLQQNLEFLSIASPFQRQKCCFISSFVHSVRIPRKFYWPFDKKIPVGLQSLSHTIWILLLCWTCHVLLSRILYMKRPHNCAGTDT